MKMKNNVIMVLFSAALLFNFLVIKGKSEDTNLIRNGDFEQVTSDDQLANWSGQTTTVLVKEGNNNFIRFKDGGWITQKITVKPNVKAFLISAKMKASNLILGENSWNDMRVNCYYKIAGDEKNYYTAMPTLKTDSDWKTIEVISDVKLGADTLVVEPALLCKGIAEFDDIKVIPLVNEEELVMAREKIIEASLLTIKNEEFIEGKFEFLDKNGLPLGWTLSDPELTKVIDESKIKTLVLNNDDPKKSPRIMAMIKIEPLWKKIRISARTSGNVQQGTESWSAGKIHAFFMDYSNNKISEGWPQFGNIIGFSDWKTEVLELSVPNSKSYLLIEAGLIGGATGIYKIQNISIKNIE